MKRIAALLLILMMILTLAACGEDAASANAPSSTGATQSTGEHVHDLGDWKVYTQPSEFAPGESRRTCAGCGEYESKKLYDTMFTHYAGIARELGGFTTEYKPTVGDIINAAMRNGIHRTTTQEGGNIIHRVTVASMNDFTTKCLGYTCDYTEVKDLDVLWESVCDYDAATDSLVITTQPVGGDEGSVMENIAFTTDDDIRFEVTVTYINPEGDPWYATMVVELVGENYIIKEHNW